MTTTTALRALSGAFLTVLVCLVLGVNTLACGGDQSAGGSGGGGTTASTESQKDPRCLEADRGGAGGAAAGYGCARASEFDDVCAGTVFGPKGWDLAFRCTCLEEDCQSNGLPCVSHGAFSNGLCAECVAGGSPEELGLGCAAAQPFLGATPETVSDGQATYCCGPDHGERCVRDKSSDLGATYALCTEGYGAGGKPYFYECLSDGDGGPSSDCVGVIGGVGTEGYCCAESRL